MVLQILTGGDLFVTRYTFVTPLIIQNVELQRMYNKSNKRNDLLFFVTYLFLLHFEDFLCVCTCKLDDGVTNIDWWW